MLGFLNHPYLKDKEHPLEGEDAGKDASVKGPRARRVAVFFFGKLMGMNRVLFGKKDLSSKCSWPKHKNPEYFQLKKS